MTEVVVVEREVPVVVVEHDVEVVEVTASGIPGPPGPPGKDGAAIAFVAPLPPVPPEEGMLWVDTSDNNKLKVYNNGVWLHVNSQEADGVVPPLSDW